MLHMPHLLERDIDDIETPCLQSFYYGKWTLTCEGVFFMSFHFGVTINIPQCYLQHVWNSFENSEQGPIFRKDMERPAIVDELQGKAS
ncbi:unnamed protein product [Cylicostephanus goldi]|uniref:Uncharacterized protein n=1 Tax=Cylicostephanus goldi TaxID=71465 RepID=A0A3P6RPH6_CYLGO|nr:unnamed protein product [Cylicostephanus goldi]